MLKTPLFATVIGLAMITTPALANDADSKQITVEYKDLDLSTAEGQKKLDRRIDRAAADVCDANDVRTGTRVRSPERVQCVKEARAAVKQHVAAKIEKAQMGG